MTAVRVLQAVVCREPELTAVSPLLRRRMSRLTRLAVSAAFDCCTQAGVSASAVSVVMASRHGEMDVTVELLNQMASREPLSPMAFSGSVHHTAIGYFSMAAANTQVMRAVAGGDESFEYGFLDAAGLAAEQPHPVLLLAADERVPPPFADAAADVHEPYAVALLLGHPEQAKGELLRFGLRPATGAFNRPPGSAALDFLAWFRSKEKSFTRRDGRQVWLWER